MIMTLNDAHRKIALSLLILVFALQFKAFSSPPNQYTIGLSTQQFDASAVPPGSIIFINSGTRSYLGIKNIRGTVSQPIIIKSSGGKVIISTDYGYGMRIQNSSHFIIDGKQGPFEYNIYINKLGKGQGISLEARSTDFVVRGLEINGPGFAGIMAKSDPYCTNTVTAENFIMQNCVFENNYIHDTGNGEGMYIGYTFPTKALSPCGTVVNSHRCKNITIQNNLVERTGADGLQVSQCTSGLILQNNLVLNYGVNPFGNYQNSGLSIGAGNYGIIRNNYIVTSDAGGNGISIIGSDDLDVVNNIIVHKGGIGIYADEQHTSYPATPGGKGMYIDNNTIIGKTGCNEDAIQLRTQLVTNTVRNNVIVNPASKYVIKYSADVPIVENTNRKVVNTSTLGFNDAVANDFKLQSNSILVNAGTVINTTTTDYAGMPRPVGSSYDIGAYEYQGSSGNSLPSINSGNDQSVALPQNSLQLTGIASDVDGNISGWLWIKQSGPSATLSGTTSNQLSISNLVEGVYVFRCTVTDNLGGQSWDETTVTVTAGNLAPTAILTTSAFSGSLLINSPLTLTAEATDVDGTISKVAFMNGNTLLVEDFSSPFTYTTSPQTAGLQSYHVIATDNKGTQTISANKQVTIVTGVSCLGSGTILREQWNNLSGSSLSGQNLDALIPTSSSLLTEISIISNVGDNYASRMRGYICAPLSGNYTFWIAGDDNCELWLSTDGSSANKQKIATVIGWSNIGEYTKYSGQQSALINLTAGQNYYIEVLQKEATGEDHVSVGWRLPEGTLERPISSNRISAYVNQVPVAQTGSEITLTLPEDSVVLYSSSYDIDGSILNYSWTKQQGNGTIKGNSNGSTLSVKNLGVGAHIYRLTVTDNSGAQHFVDQKITVKTANLAPISNAGINQTLTLPQNSITLNGFGSDQDGSIVDYLWTQINGPAATMQQVYTPNLELSNLVTGSYTFRLMAMDNMGLTSTDDAVVTVLPGIKTVVYRVNCGGPILADLPIDWAADDNLVNSVNLDTLLPSQVSISKDFAGVNTTGAPDEMLTDFRYDNSGKTLRYNFPVNNGDYQIRLFFAENRGSLTSRSKARLFSIELEELVVLENLDIYDEAGNDALEKEFNLIIIDGMINLILHPIKNSPSISGIEISSTSALNGNKNLNNTNNTTSGLNNNVSKQSSLKAYPNPFTDQITVEIETIDNEDITYLIVDLSGRVIEEKIVKVNENNNSYQFDISNKNLAAGMYFIKALQGENSYIKKVIKN